VDWAKALAGPNQAHNDMAALAAHIKQPLPLHHNGLSGFTAKTFAKLLEVDACRDLWSASHLGAPVKHIVRGNPLMKIIWQLELRGK
jgi:hypothetical protein